MQERQPIIPGYDVVRLIGSGGSGTVWAVRRDDGMRLAAKVLPAGEAQEAMWAQQVVDDHLLPVLDVVAASSDGESVTCLVMPLAEGGSLDEVIRARGHLTAGELVTVVVPIARAVHRLHSLGLVHGDLKPSNVLLTADGRPMLADLGAASLPAQTGDVEVWATQLWSAPEVLGGSAASAASDCFGLGAIAWACATGEAPQPAAMRPLLSDVATQLDRGLCDVITACLSHTPSARPDAAGFAELVWATAVAEPAPVALSAGARTAPPPGDPGVELTRRIRAQAVTEALTEPEPPSRRWLWARLPVGSRGQSPSRAGSGRYSAIGSYSQESARSDRVSADNRATAGVRRRDARPLSARHAAQESVQWGRWLVLAACGVALLVGTGWWFIAADSPTHATAAAVTKRLVTQNPATAAPVASATTTSVAVDAKSTPAEPAAKSTTAKSTPPATAVTATPPSGATATPPPSGGSGALADPVSVLRPLLTTRAQAWNAVDPGRLTGAFVAGSAAWQQDSAALSTVKARAATYRDVGFDVRSAQVTQSTGDTARLRAVIVRSACRLLIGDSEQAVPEQTSTVDFDLTATTDGWRISTWRAV